MPTPAFSDDAPQGVPLPAQPPLPPTWLIPLLRTAGVALLLGPAIAFFCWLTLTCADFLGVIHFGRGLTRNWGDFALRVSLGALLPPALLAALDTRRPWLLSLREAGRAVVIAFSLFALGFFLVGVLILRFGSSLHIVLVPALLGRVGPILMCALFYLSYRLITLMLPQPQPEGPPPAAIRLFLPLAAALTLFPVVQAMAPLAPLGLPALDPSFYDVRALPQDVFLFAATAWLIGRRGLRMFRPVYVGICLLGPVLTLLEPGVYPLPWQLFHLLRAAVSVVACACLYMPSTRRWLAA